MDFVCQISAWVEAFHIISVMFWMAGMYYLPRLFVYHAEAIEGGQEYGVFEKMEANLLRIIMNPAMIAAWTFGLYFSPVRDLRWAPVSGCGQIWRLL